MEYLEQHRASKRFSNLPINDKSRRIHKEKLDIPFFDFLMKAFFGLLAFIGIYALINGGGKGHKSSKPEQVTSHY